MQGHNSKAVTEERKHEIANFLIGYPELIADAKAQASRTEWLAKLVLAELTTTQTGKSHAERENKAMLIDTYRRAKEVEIQAERNETFVKAKYAANELLLGLYQTESANFRSTKL